jgi:hypothetical protein
MFSSVNRNGDTMCGETCAYTIWIKVYLVTKMHVTLLVFTLTQYLCSFLQLSSHWLCKYTHLWSYSDGLDNVETSVFRKLD